MQTFRTVNVPFVPGHIERIKERDTLDVIPMGVADQNAPVPAPVVSHQLLRKRASACSAVDNNEGSSRRVHLNAGCVATVTAGTRPRRGDRSTSSPKSYSHHGPPLVVHRSDSSLMPKARRHKTFREPLKYCSCLEAEDS